MNGRNKQHDELTTTEASLTIIELARHCGTTPRLIERFWALGLIEHEPEAEELRFSAEVLTRINTMLRLRRDLGVGVSAMGLVFDLLERIETLERRLAHLDRQEE